MSDFDSNKNVFEVLRRAAERVDGIAMYAFSIVIILLALVLQFHLEDLLPFHVRSQDHAWVLLFVPPAVFVMYVCLGTWSRSDSRREQIWNATIIVVGGIYTIYKNYFQLDLQLGDFAYMGYSSEYEDVTHMGKVACNV